MPRRAGRTARADVAWFQAEQACRLSGKRLLRNEEWQAAAAGTPDPGVNDDHTATCATNSDFAALTGARSSCISLWGAHDMAGNVWEWVAEWTAPSGTARTVATSVAWEFPSPPRRRRAPPPASWSRSMPTSRARSFAAGTTPPATATVSSPSTPR
ncbi:MAG: hypothetical protein E6J70_06345 [Deltaproteobacteria bacterium]|nr:MAG: hypothetical protein E6J70_06345 [Deltaproteobacteria bacterium]